MANPEHLEILRQGVEVWNDWFRKNPNISVDLSGADLSEMCLKDVDLSGTTLRSVVFTKADLTLADLSMADLEYAVFKESNLTAADLRGSIMNHTDLQEANLTAAVFGFTDLEGTVFSRAKFSLTMLNAIDLSKAIGLHEAEHEYSSSIDTHTIYKSKGNIPTLFLRGCGVPDQMIEFTHSLTVQSIEYYSCFISYSHKDEVFAQRLHADLQANNVRCWYASHDLPIGAKTRPAIDEAIRIHDKLLIILSENSIESNWVEHEAEHALDLETERGKLMLFPVRLDNAIMASKAGWASNVKRQRNIGDFTKWKDHDAYKKAFDRLLQDLKAE